MKLWIMSDLHLDAHPFDLRIPSPTPDMLVVAGDVATPLSTGIRWLRKSTDLPIVMVAGNADFYGTRLADEKALARQLAAEAGIHFLEEDGTIAQGVRFLGATLWTDYTLDGDYLGSMKAATVGMTDHREIGTGYGAFRPEDAASAHRRARAWLDGMLAQPFNGPTVVVTHHAPTPRSIGSRFAGDPLNPAFASDLTDLIIRHAPDIWVHGHVHEGGDYRVGLTRVVCNPKGYAFEPTGFMPDFVVDI
ncbi:metallophosphoesterase [Azorhizobium sp. AG788]|uniref:metallophosphoesterase n=1 Tax=Azorhizobium sp. AG788 TaxID=2183897 RepID=UPI003139E08B